MGRIRSRYKYIEHTGDLGIRLQAPSLPALFRVAARALFEVLVEGEGALHPAACVTLQAADRDRLLVDWLNELLYLHTVGGWVLRAFRLQQAGDTRLLAVVGGERFDPVRHRALREVKAATFHGLKIEEHRGAWRAQVVLDL